MTVGNVNDDAAILTLLITRIMLKTVTVIS
jgi:hypothetical protein